MEGGRRQWETCLDGSLTFFLLVSLLAIIGYQLVCLADLQFDHSNPYDSATWINLSVVPEFVMQGVLCIAYLITRHWFMCLLCLPYLCYDIRLTVLVSLNRMAHKIPFFICMATHLMTGNRRGWNTPNRFPQRQKTSCLA